MNSSQIVYRVLTSFSEVSTYLPKVVHAADGNKDALGFFADSVFKDFARRDLLFVLVVKEDGVEIYAGHLLFDEPLTKGKQMRCRLWRARYQNFQFLPRTNGAGSLLTLRNWFSLNEQVQTV